MAHLFVNMGWFASERQAYRIIFSTSFRDSALPPAHGQEDLILVAATQSRENFGFATLLGQSRLCRSFAGTPARHSLPLPFKSSYRIRTNRKREPLAQLLIRKFTNFGRDIVFSADLWYNGTNEKPPSEREGDRVSGGRSLRDFRFVSTFLLHTLPQSPSVTAPSRREP